MTAQQIRALIHGHGDLPTAIRDADPEDKATLYRGLRLKLTYQPATHTVRAEAHLEPHNCGVMVGVRGSF